MSLEPEGQLQDILRDIRSIRVAGTNQIKNPHQFVLLLTLVDILESNPNAENRFHFAAELQSRFLGTWRKYLNAEPAYAADALQFPYYHLSSSGLWILTPRPEARERFQTYADKNNEMRFTARRIRETIEYGSLREDLISALRDQGARNTIRKVLIELIAKATSNSPQGHSVPSRSRFEHEGHAIQIILERLQSAQLGSAVGNFEVFDANTNDYYECDLIVVCAFGVFVTELKHWTGRIQVAPRSWLINGSQHRPDPHASNRFKCKVLRGIYRHSFNIFPDLWFESVVVLTNPEAEVTDDSPTKTDQHNPTFASINRFIDFLRYRQTQATGPLLNFEQIKAVVAKFESLRVRDHVKGYNFPGYEVVERLTQREDLVELIVRPTEGRRRNLQRFRAFCPPLNVKPDDRARFLRKANNTLDALAKAGEHPNLLRVWNVPNEFGHVIEGSEWSEEGTLADLLDRSPGGVSWEEALPLVRGMLEGLVVVHKQAVIHRMLKPENVLLCGVVPRLMNFDLAYQLEENHVTVIPDVSLITPNPYIAPEVYLKREPSEATDLFSVGVILFELLTGRTPFKASADLATTGGLLQDAHFKGLPKTIPDIALQVIRTLVQTEPDKRFQRAEEVLELLAPVKAVEQTPLPSNRELGQGETYDLFQIEALHARGGHSQIYRAIRGSQQERVALKVFNADVSQDRARAELRAAQAIDSPYAERVESLGHWRGERFFLAMNLVDGPSLRQEIQAKRLPVAERFVEVAQALLQAVRQLHGRTVDGKPAALLHNDIKPDNILLRAENHPVLIDFGVASAPGVATYVGTEGYVAPDLRNGADLEFCPNGDLFALGVTLFEWLYGVTPYETTIVGASCRDVSNRRDQPLPLPLHQWLVEAVATTKAKRFASADDMLQSLTQAWVAARTPALSPEPLPVPEPTPIETTVPEVILGGGGSCGGKEDIGGVFSGNPFLAYLNSLHNTTGSNENALAEAQARSRYFTVIHVRSAVAEFARKQITGSERRHILLTGHAGDGKSTIGLELFKTLKGLPMERPLDVPWKAVEEIHLPGKPPITMVKDMSELSAADRLSILTRACSNTPERLFIISNTGTLLETFRAMTKGAGQWSELEHSLLEALSANPPSSLTRSAGIFDVVNLVQVDNLNTALDIFQRMLDEKAWGPCLSQPCQQACPVYRNVRLLRENWPLIRERVGAVYRRLFEYGDRLTLRQMTAHLAYAITSGLSCQDVFGHSLQPISRPITDFLFFNRFWGEGATGFDDRSLQLKAVRALKRVGVGRQLLPTLERKLWMRDEDEPLPTIPTDLQPVFLSLRQLGRKLAHVEGMQPDQGRAQTRRLLFFFGQFQQPEVAREYLATFLNSRMLPEFAAWQSAGGKISNIDRDRLLKNVLHVLQEHFAGLHLPEEVSSLDGDLYITLNRRGREIRQSAQVVLARLSRSDFKLQLVEKAWPGVSCRFELLLTESHTGKQLKLELPFLDFVMQRHTGDIASSIKAGYLDRLERFKAQLLNSHGGSADQEMMLVRLQTNHRFATQKFALNDGVLEVL
jgi:serine/threonine protein kinase